MSNFIFDNISSHIFGLAIGSIGDTSVVEKNTYTDIEIIEDRSAKRIEPYIFDVKLPTQLEFPLEIYNKHGHYYESYEVQAIQEWLFGRKKPHYLTILEPDKGNESLFCFLVNPQIVMVSGHVYGWKFNVRSVRGYAETDIVEESYECLESISNIHYYNLSNIEDYIYPEMSIKLLSETSYIRIENENDNNRVFQIINLKPASTIYINNSLGYMISESGDNVFQYFNLNWFRFSPGFNKLLVDGKCVITFRNRFLKAVSSF